MDSQTDAAVPKRGLIQSEDWLAVVLGALVLLVVLGTSIFSRAPNFDERLTAIDQGRQQLKQQSSDPNPPTEDQAKALKNQEEKLKKQATDLFPNPLKPRLAKVGSWKSDPKEAFVVKDKPITSGLLGIFGLTLVLFALGCVLQRQALGPFIIAFAVLFLLTTLGFLLAGQEVIKYYNFEYPLWALLIGMVISNTIGTPAFLKPAMRTELYIKTGLVLFGAEILLSRLLMLGLPGICVSWVVTPITLISTYLFGQYVLRIPSKSLNLVISADMAVCGVSAAIATGAACRAKKEEVSLAIGISLAFTAVMMVVMPLCIKQLDMNPVVAGAWIGGTIDSTGAVAVAGKMIGDSALQAAVTVKMIQNILIGVVAFAVAVYWVMFVEQNDNGPRPGLSEIWLRFPKFVLGFIGASAIFSLIYSSGTAGAALAESVTGVTGEILRVWLFGLAFVAIGLETNFRELSGYLKDGKAVVLYICGQSLNLALTLLMAWIMFVLVFPQTAEILK